MHRLAKEFNESLAAAAATLSPEESFYNRRHLTELMEVDLAGGDSRVDIPETLDQKPAAYPASTSERFLS